MSNAKLWGIDLGGTKIECAVLDSNLDTIVRKRIATEADKGYPHILSQIKKLIDQVSNEIGEKPSGIGFATPGALEPETRVMKNCNTVCMNGMLMKDDLEKTLDLPVKLENDANCFALAETHWGIVKEKFPKASMVFGIIMGSGVGGGIVTNGKVWNGHHGIAGEWGHNYLDDSGGACYCGKTGCVETIISGPALQRFYASITRNNITLKEIVARYQQNTDEAAAQTIQRLCHFFGKAVSVVTNLLDPDVIVIGGGVGNIDALYTEGIESLKEFIFNNGVSVPVLKPSLGDSAGVFGAAALVANS